MGLPQQMKFALFTLITLGVCSATLLADIHAVPESVSPDGKIHAVMDVDRDPKISPEWKGDSYPQVEITEKSTGRVLASIEYFGAVGDDERPLREHVKISWRADSKALAITINDRFYSSSTVYAMDESSKFIRVPFPSYSEVTGFPEPDRKHLRPRGRVTVAGWDKDNRLIYDFFYSPLPTFTGNDPLVHRAYLEVTATHMKPVKVEHEKGKWQLGDWIPSKAGQ
jgi:hypothetical protein